MKYIFNILLTMLILFQFSCKSDKKEIITKKIQYDVNIKSPNPDYDWWIQNIVGPDRDKLINLIVDGAKSGKWQAYDYFNDSIDKYEVRSIFVDTSYVTLLKTEPPYEQYDTIIIRKILPKDIVRLRFMEEWAINPDNLAFTKKVVGIAPVASRLDFNGVQRWQPLFWVYTDDDFLKGIRK